MKRQGNRDQLVSELLDLCGKVLQVEGPPATTTAVDADLLHAIIEGTTDSVLVKDLAGRYVLVNSAGAQLLGKPPNEIIGKSDEELFPVEVARESASRDCQALAFGATYTEECVLVCQGEPHTYLSTVGTYRNRSGERAGVFRILRDITPRKQREAALSESEHRFRAFMNQSPIIASIKSEEGRYIYVNEPFEHHFHRPMVEIIGKTDEDLWPRDIARELKDHDQVVLQSGRAAELLETVPTASGPARNWRAYKFPLADSRGARLVGSLAIEISEHEQLRHQLSHSHKMEVVGMLAQALTHRLNNLLTGIVGFSELLLTKTDSDKDEQEALREIREAGSAATSMLHHLAALGHEHQAKPAVVDVNDLARDTASLLSLLLGEQFYLHTDLQAQVSQVRADVDMLQFLLIGLVLDSKPDSTPSGEVFLSTCDDSDNWVRLTVAQRRHATLASSDAAEIPAWAGDILQHSGGLVEAGQDGDGGKVYIVRLPAA